ncbi:hypothetical protein D2T29_16315 [Sinirhodobacter populi]|uniref:Uncharacterized protein n=1 Tax=Paenirhodobacter populi TaxID=2306993 RepID=A0A443IRS7_9RHOB|nr:hypothetical protein [Sinirhodobacter populi]RWR09201.1 hypothetical protein D2T33_14485 [Sinirhodobacter populi]RWR25899.1 hypothetical protein D2T31_21490 [Sinirhodobacter populi]RWR28776.1 hypothetical protein D2T29_16315 [Sinirhodobacter populi]
MSAEQIFAFAPLGALIRYTDDQPKPPARFTKKLAAWQRDNGVGRLVRKDSGRSSVHGCTFPPTITLHEGDFSSAGVILVMMHRTYSVTSDLRFSTAELPRPGMVRVVQVFGDTTELLHLAENREAAELWLAKNPHHLARFEVVGDETPPDPAAFAVAA